jgi:NSS family neurotransmitter:Na+ symporter
MESRKTRFTRWGFIFATVGSAVGLGNIWKFPYITGEYGGGAFVLVYLLTIMFVGISILIAEMFLGNYGKSDAVSTFEMIGNELPEKKPSMRYLGFMTFNGLIIMTFYSVVIGWIFYYIYSAINGLPTTVSEAETEFSTLIGENIWTQIFFHTFATLTILHFVNGGIKKGIEKLNNLLIPSLLVIMVGLLIYSMTLPAFGDSFKFLFYPEWDKLSSEAFIRAVGHSFFTLSLGMGAIITYSASVPNSINLTKSALTVGFFDTVIALVAGLVIFTFLFQYGEEPSKGAGLVFISMPVIFSQMGEIGSVISVLFLSALAMAGLTSAVSLVEPAVLYVINRFNMSRFRATISMGFVYWLIGIFAILSYSTTYGETFSLFGKPIFDILETTTDSLLLPLSGIFIALVTGYAIRKVDLKKLQIEMGDVMFRVWYFSIRVISPIAVLFLMLNLFGVIEL